MDWERSSLGVRIVRQVQEIINEMKNYLPMTLRQIHYQLVTRNIDGYENTQNKYKQLSSWLYDARVDGLISWSVMTDRSRGFLDYTGYTSAEHYLKAQISTIPSRYYRNLLQTQDEVIEIWTEKDALATVIARTSQIYTVAVQPCRGFGSGSQFDQVARRQNGKALHILYFGDHDPSGLWMSEKDIKSRLKKKHDIDVCMERIALNREQTDEYGLDQDFQIAKDKDLRTQWYIENYGEECWELDALPPDILSTIVLAAIEERIDMDLYHDEEECEKEDKSKIKEIVKKWNEYLE